MDIFPNPLRATYFCLCCCLFNNMERTYIYSFLFIITNHKTVYLLNQTLAVCCTCTQRWFCKREVFREVGPFLNFPHFLLCEPSEEYNIHHVCWGACGPHLPLTPNPQTLLFITGFHENKELGTGCGLAQGFMALHCEFPYTPISLMWELYWPIQWLLAIRRYLNLNSLKWNKMKNSVPH